MRNKEEMRAEKPAEGDTGLQTERGGGGGEEDTDSVSVSVRVSSESASLSLDPGGPAETVQHSDNIIVCWGQKPESSSATFSFSPSGLTCFTFR